MLAICVRFRSCLCIACSYVSEALMLGSVLACAKSAHVFQKLSYLLCRLCLSLSSLISLLQTVRLFYVSLHSQGPQQQYTELSFSMRKHGHSHKLTSSCALRYYTGHTFLRRIGLLHSIACSHVITITITYMLRRGIQKHWM